MFYQQIAIDSIEKARASANSSKAIDHRLFQGRYREIIVNDLLRPFLNPRYKLVTGKIIDQYGNQSKQIDIIIYDEQITPPILLNTFEGIIPCHSVLATIEVKSKLNATSLREAIENARSVKLLKYDYDKIPLSGEKGFEMLFRSKLIDKLPDDTTKTLLKDALFRISSPACYVIALDSDLGLMDNCVNEQKRFTRAVNKSIKINEIKINIPISGLCIWDRLFYYCKYINPLNNEGIFTSEVLNETEKQDFINNNDYKVSHSVVLRFISEITNTCNVYSYQRSRIPLEVYFQLGF
jgi:hypothetical protein